MGVVIVAREIMDRGSVWEAPLGESLGERLDKLRPQARRKLARNRDHDSIADPCISSVGPLARCQPA